MHGFVNERRSLFRYYFSFSEITYYMESQCDLRHRQRLVQSRNLSGATDEVGRRRPPPTYRNWGLCLYYILNAIWLHNSYYAANNWSRVLKCMCCLSVRQALMSLLNRCRYSKSSSIEVFARIKSIEVIVP